MSCTHSNCKMLRALCSTWVITVCRLSDMRIKEIFFKELYKTKGSFFLHLPAPQLIHKPNILCQFSSLEASSLICDILNGLIHVSTD